MKTSWPLLGGTVLVLLAATPAANADIGPKPHMSFHFDFSQVGDDLEIIGGVLEGCGPTSCDQPIEFKEMGPQSFTCSRHACNALAYGFNSDYHHIKITFSDGRERVSNIFGKKAFEASYRVVVTDDALQVTETNIAKNKLKQAMSCNCFGLPRGLVFRYGSFLVAALIIVVGAVGLFIFRRRQSRHDG